MNFDDYDEQMNSKTSHGEHFILKSGAHACEHENEDQDSRIYFSLQCHIYVTEVMSVHSIHIVARAYHNTKEFNAKLFLRRLAPIAVNSHVSLQRLDRSPSENSRRVIRNKQDLPKSLKCTVRIRVLPATQPDLVDFSSTLRTSLAG